MFPIKIENGVASLVVSKTRRLSNRQLATLKATEAMLGPDAGQNYLASLLGLVKRRMTVKRASVAEYAYDKLMAKPKGRIQSLFESLLNCDEDTDHIPSNRKIGEWIGVEIECYYPAESDYGDCSCEEGNCECEPNLYPNEEEAQALIRKLVRAAKIPRVSVKGDGSLRHDEGSGVEVTILFNAADGFEPLERLCKVLNDAGCFVDKTCGLHVHLDARHLKPKGVKLIGRRLGRALPILKWIVDPSRHTNNYCKLEVGPLSRSSSQRYFAVNLNAFYRYKTVEIRMHGGSTNARKIKSWIELLRFLASSKVPKSFTTFQQLIDLGCPSHLVEYADKRISRLNPTAWVNLIPTSSSNGDAA